MIGKTVLLYVVTAVAELVGCYLPMLWLRGQRGIWVLLPAMVSLGTFAYLLTLHPSASGRVYAAYGGVYIGTAIAWLWVVDGIAPSRWDLAGALIAGIGMVVIILQPEG